MNEIIFEERCRICLSTKQNNLQLLGAVTIDDSAATATTTNVKLINFIEKIVNIKFLRIHNYPSWICQQCIDSFTKVYKLSNLCIEHEEVIKTRVKEQSINLFETCSVVSNNSDKNNKQIKSFAKLKETRKKTKSNFTCSTEQSFKKHLKMPHDEEIETAKAKENSKYKYKCDACNKQFPFPSTFLKHMKTHTGEKPFLCPICGKSYQQNSTLSCHIQAHNGIKKFQCKMCNQYFVSAGTLKVHMRIHTGERPYVCDICGNAFKQSTDMKRHHLLHSGDEKHALCFVCGKKFSTTGQLTVHMRSHTGEKPFKCINCTKGFTTKSMLVKHNRIHTGERPYSCNLCEKRFNQTSSLNTHLKIHKTKPNVSEPEPERERYVEIKKTLKESG